MISAFANAFKIPELKKRLVFTLWIIVLTRFGAAISVPGVDTNVLADIFRNMEKTQGGSFMALLNIFSGGAIEHFAIFSLTVMPYISASIIMQLLTAVVPQLSKIAREEGGRQKVTQYTRFFTVVIALFQSFFMSKGFEHPDTLRRVMGFKQLAVSPVVNPGLGFELTTMITLTCGTVLMMWLGEQISERGIGNGISMLIATNILARFPAAVTNAVRLFFPPPGQPATYNLFHGVLFITMFVGVIGAVILITQAQRRITVQYAQRMVGRKVYAGGQTYMPLKANYSGVMPIIFAQAILMLPAFFFGWFKLDWLNRVLQQLNSGTWVYIFVYSVLVFAFSFFWVATMFNPVQIADDLKKHGGYVPGVRPGKPTADFLDYTMTRITFAGAIFLIVVAILPSLLHNFLNLDQTTTSFFGGTSLLIVVGVLLDTLRQIETHLITRNYEGFLKKGRMKGRI